MKSIQLHKGREESVLRGHPWIFSRAIQSPVSEIKDGELVTIMDFRNRFLGIGHFQNSSLAVRILTLREEEIDDVFWKNKLESAATYRRSLGIYQEHKTEALRLVHGEGDQLPGLIIDIYGPVAVVQAHSIGMHKARKQIAKALTSISGLVIKSVYSKSKDALPGNYASGIIDEWLINESSDLITIKEGGIDFSIDVVGGQKTGFFLDQRENRDLLRRYANGASVLNCFSYSGGFSLYALDGGAHDVTSVDTSAGALEGLEKNLLLNNFSGDHHLVKENVLTFLSGQKQQYDIVVIDPPAFAKNLNKRHNAIQAYKRLNIMAMSRVRKGGLLFTFSCSQVVDRPMFYNTVVAAAIEAGRPARVAHELSQGPDHPVSIFHPEGHYLKGLVLCLD